MKASGLADSPLFLKPKEKEKPPSNHTTSVSCNHDTMVECISNAVQEVGKEASTYRLTKGEKHDLTKIIYELKMHNIYITENTIIRIGLNYIIQDTFKTKQNSLLHKIIIDFP